jgi:hypothetical protein
MQVYLANPTLATRIFLYRVVEGTAIRQTTVAPRRQVKLPEDFDGDGLRYLIEQIERAGGVNESDLKALEKPHALVYKVAPKPISSDRIDEAVERELRATQELSAQQTEAAGLVTLATLERPAPGTVRAASLEVTQMNDSAGGREEPAKGGVDVEVRVDRAAPGKPIRGRRRG